MITFHITYTAMNLFCFCMWFFISIILMTLEFSGKIQIKGVQKEIMFVIFTAPASIPAFLIAFLIRIVKICIHNRKRRLAGK